MRTSSVRAACLLAAFGSAAPVGAQAASTNFLSEFNAIVFGNFSTSADVEGRTVIGGDMTGGATFALKLLSGTSSYSPLTVYGDETSRNWFNVDQGGGVTVLGSNRGNFNLNGGGDVFVGGSNSGHFGATTAISNIAIGGSNTGSVSLNNGGSVSIGGSNGQRGRVSVSGGAGHVAVLGANAAPTTLNAGGSVFVGGANTGSLSVNGSGGDVAINGSNTAQVTLNNGGTVRINGDTGNVTLNGGSLAYAGTVTGNLNLNGGATTSGPVSLSLTAPAVPAVGLPDFTTTFETPMKTLSSQLAGLSSNSSVLVVGNRTTLSAAPDPAGQAVLDVSSSLFAANTSIGIDLNGASSLVINVTIPGCAGSTGCALSLPGSLNFTDPTSYARHVIWNFIDATSLAFHTEFGGTVLSPYASVTNNGPIDGTLVAAQFTGSGELHSYGFSGALDLPIMSQGGAAPAPEPSSLALLGAGVAALGLLRRRRSGARARRKTGAAKAG